MAGQEIQAQISKRLIEINNEAGKDPEQALSDGMALPVTAAQHFSPRAAALLDVARASVKKKPRVAKSALDELVKMSGTRFDGMLVRVLLRGLKSERASSNPSM